MLWLPADLVAKGYSVGASSKLLAGSASIALPTVFLAALLYSRWTVRGRATGWIAACTKTGGLFAQALTISGVILTMGLSAGLIMVLTALSLILLAWFGRETRGSDLGDLDSNI